MGLLGHLDLIEPDLGKRVAAAMNMTGQADRIRPAVEPRDDLPPSPALSIVGKATATVKGRCLAALVTDQSDAKAVANLQRALKKEGAQLKLIAPKIGKLRNDLVPDMTLEGGPSVLFDAVVLLPDDEDIFRTACRDLAQLAHVAGASSVLVVAVAMFEALVF